MTTLNWRKCEGNVWCPLNTVGLEHACFDDLEGVYIIWISNSANPPNSQNTVYVGQGIIRDRLEAHREDSRIQEYGKDATLYVTWAEASELDRIERYLADTLKPKVGDKHPDVEPLEVNLPK